MDKREALKNLSANMIGDYNARRPNLFTEKLVGGIRACVGFVYDDIRARYVPNTVLNLDMRDSITNRMRIIAVYGKDRKEKYYSKLVYMAKKVDWSKVKYPSGYEYLSELE